MNSMNRTITPCWRPNVAKSTTSSSLTPRMSTTLIFTGSRPALDRRVDAIEHLVQLVATGELGEPRPLQRVERDVDPPQAGLGQRVGQQVRAWRRWW